MLRNDALAAAAVRLQPRAPPPPHYYATNLLLMVETVLARYADVLTAEERAFGEGVRQLPAAAQRLLARMIGRSRALLRDDTLRYDEVGDANTALAALQAAGLVERNASASLPEILSIFTVAELRGAFGELPLANTAKAECVARVTAHVPAAFARWRLRRRCGWARVNAPALSLYHLHHLLFFGSRHGELRTFVMRDLGVHIYEPVPLCAETRQFRDRALLERYLALLAAEDEVRALGERPAPAAVREAVPPLLELLWHIEPDRLLERRRSRVLGRLGRNLERAGAFDAALSCYRRSTQPPARERRMRILRRLQDAEGVEGLRAAIGRNPCDAMEADFAKRFGRPARRPTVPTVEHRLAGGLSCEGQAPRAPLASERPPLRALSCEGQAPRAPPLRALPCEGQAPRAPRLRALSVEAFALGVLTAGGGAGWHLENNLPMGLFALAYWSWLFAPVPGAFVHPFQTAPVDLFWPDFFAVRTGVCEDPLATPLKPRLRAAVYAKAGTANRLFNWRRLTPAVAAAVIDAMPEEHLRALVEIVRDDLAGKCSGFPDLTLVYAPGRYEFVEVKGPNDRLQTHQHLWIEALRQRGLPVRVMRLRP